VLKRAFEATRKSVFEGADRQRQRCVKVLDMRREAAGFHLRMAPYRYHGSIKQLFPRSPGKAAPIPTTERI